MHLNPEKHVMMMEKLEQVVPSSDIFKHPICKDWLWLLPAGTVDNTSDQIDLN